MKAAIDIGTNTALLLVAEINHDRLKVIREEQRVPRLGEGVDQSGYISAVAIERVTNALKEYRDILDQQFTDIEQIYVTATSAARDAINKSELVEQVKRATSFRINILSGLEEARYTYLGALSVLDDELAARENVVLDIGGGSTELVWGSGQKIQDRYSFDMGCVRFTERFLKEDPPGQSQVDACRSGIRKMLGEHSFNFAEKTELVGVAGTVTSLAFINRQMEEYSSKQLAGTRISKQEVDRYTNCFKKLPSSELLKRYPSVMEGRADIFLAGLLILEQVMEAYQFSQLRVSTGGIRHGAICEKAL